MPHSETFQPPGAVGSDVAFTVRLPRSTSAAGAARRIVVQRFGALLVEETLHDALLVVSELVTNAVLDGVGDIELRLAFDGQRVTGEVIDEGLRPTQQPPQHIRDVVGGHGLHLVSHVTESWGREGSGRVWFEILAQRPL